MSHLETTGDQGRYNEVAIKYENSGKNSSIKINFNFKVQLASTCSGDDLFPSFNRAGLGVYREYEQMGNQPVTDGFAGAGRPAGSDVRTPWSQHRDSAT